MHRPDPALAARARELTRSVLLLDAHIDVPFRLKLRPADIAGRTDSGHFDWPRAREGGLDAAFFAIYVPATHQEPGSARPYADALIDLVEATADAAPEKFGLATSPDGVRRVVAGGRMAIALGLENGAAIENDLANVEHFFRRGVRYVTLTHSADNAICDSSYDGAHRWNGLSPFGRDVVREMNRAGMMVDVSHVSDAALDDVLEVADTAVVASHSSCRALTPGFERNLDDDGIRRIAATGGVVQINFGSAFLTPAANEASLAAWRAAAAYVEAERIDPTGPEAERFRASWRVAHPVPRVTVDDVAAHIDHAVRIAGIERVGLGSDFDGVDAVPEGLEDVAGYPNLVAALLARGYGDEDVRKLAGENFLRTWETVERVAGRRHGGAS